ncbi:MAG: type I-U CRISPR-associated protein Cas5/Cas6 [Candidatus Eremiobacteraeota bacterium]|nr:type I-U CRISPR-associated protein Cas5/Cas6 [Candidatus Eremiobacteraeota bacterium]
MLTIQLKFLNGRYHSTPWGRNVNEGVVEWPPSPFRLLRALIDTWKRKFSDLEEIRVTNVLEALAVEPPRFHLPRASSSHTRSYLSMNKKDLTKNKKEVFDAFVVISPDSSIHMNWHDVELNPGENEVLEKLLSGLNYLGRSESWVEASIGQNGENIQYNCYPLKDVEGQIGESDEPVEVAGVIQKNEYEEAPFSPPGKGSGKKKPVKNFLSWLSALCLTSKDVIDFRLSHHPAMKTITYLRPRNCFEIKYESREKERKSRVNCVLYALESKVPPKITDTLKVAGRFREILMGIHRKIMGSKELVSQKFSGKDRKGKYLKGHQHAYFLPLDMNRDGYIDHFLILCNECFDRKELMALDQMDSLWWWSKKSYDIRLTPVFWGKSGRLPIKSSCVYKSATPFIPTRHWRKGRGNLLEWLEGEVCREARNHGLPEPTSVEWSNEDPDERHKFKMERSSLQFNWYEFIRNRKSDQPKWGYNLTLTFETPPSRPVFSLGYANHYGLGLFLPASFVGGTSPSR